MTLFFNKRRSDGQIVKGGDPMMHIMPYVMRGRNESAIYYRNTVDITSMQNYIRDKRQEGKRVTLFNIIVTAMLHLIFERPNLNRFVAGRRLYKHNSFSVLYVVKTSLTDDGAESVARVNFNENDNIFTTSATMQNIINEIKNSKERVKWDDKIISAFSGFPRWLLRVTANILRWADFHGFMPAKWLSVIPLYGSIFCSHLGSIGGGSPFHHLYEFGTTSIFVTIGKVYDKAYPTLDGGVEWRRVVDLCFTIDERICDGFYLIKSLKLLDELLQMPELLELSPAAYRSMPEEARRRLRQSISRNNRQRRQQGPQNEDSTAFSHEPY